MSELNQQILDAPWEYRKLLLDMSDFSSPAIKHRLSGLLKGEVLPVEQLRSKTIYRANLRGISRINESHEACVSAFKLLKVRIELLDCKLLPPVPDLDYMALVLKSTHFKRVNTLNVISKYFLSSEKVSLHSCMTENTSYATLHNARKRVNNTHILFISAFHLLSNMKG